MTEPTLPHFDRVAIIGVGLLGGSLGLALRRRGMVGEIVGFGRNEERLAAAMNHPEGPAIDRAETDLAKALDGANLVVCCTPVRHIVQLMPELAKAAAPGTLITDVGSTKRTVVQAGYQLAEHRIDFIGSHPMAGSDRSGVAHASSDLYEGATTFVTVEAWTPKNRVAELSRMWRAVGSRVVLIHPDRHDRIVAAISHLPHLLAVAAVETVSEYHEDHNFLRRVIGGGFRDTTRVAQGSVAMWRDICDTNPGAIIEAIDTFTEHLNGIRGQLISSNQSKLAECLERAKSLREQLNPQE